jgi:hypothetical protein
VQIFSLTDDMIEPIPGSAVVTTKKKNGSRETKTIHFWTKPLDKVIFGQLTKWRQASIDLITEVQMVELVHGGNHGQGRFAQAVKIIVRGRSRKVLATFDVKIADIDCKKIPTTSTKQRLGRLFAMILMG